MPQPQRPKRPSRLFTAVLATLVLFAVGCAANYRPAPPPVVVEPGGLSGAIVTEEWDLAAVRYRYPGAGFDLQKAGLAPVILILKNKGPRYPLIWPEETRGLSGNNEYVPIPAQQAADIVINSEIGQETAQAAVRGALAGALIGGGLGALLAAPIGGNAVWQSALVGGGIGAFAGAATTIPRNAAELQMVIDQDLYNYSWKPLPAAPYAITGGYFYFQGNPPSFLQVTIRTENDVDTYAVPVIELPAPAAPAGAPAR